MSIAKKLPVTKEKNTLKTSEIIQDIIQAVTNSLGKPELVKNPLKSGEKILDFTLSNPLGENHSLAVLRENRPAVEPERSSMYSENRKKTLPLKLKTSRKIYTRKGDLGHCSLLSGERSAKDANQVEATGDIDELNSVLGLLVSALPQKASWLSIEIEGIQESLFQIGALIATDLNSPLLNKLNSVSREQIGSLERSIDSMEDQLPELQSFIIPGGHASAAQAHFARSVCRRAERHVIKHLNNQKLKELPGSIKNLLAYLNRLSDYLFVVGRYCNILLRVNERACGNI